MRVCYNEAIPMFCDKLNDILSALDLQNNSEIGRLIGCHPSYISRIRKGDRAPSPSSRGIIKLVQGLCAQAESSGKLDELARVVGVSDPHGPDSGKERVIRGGGWESAPNICAVYKRFDEKAYVGADLSPRGEVKSVIGFRVVRNAR